MRRHPPFPLAGLVGCLLLAACGPSQVQTSAPRPPASSSSPAAGSAAASASPAPPAVGADCLSPAERRGVIHFRASNGADLGGALAGRGSLGVVLAHQSNGTLCQWWYYAGELAGRGIRALAFDFEGSGSSTAGRPVPDSLGLDVAAAVAALKKAGAARVVLIGASMGGTAVLCAAAHADPAVVAVVALSGPTSFLGCNAAAAVPRIRVPLLVAAAAADSPYADAARELYRQATAPGRRLVVVPGNGHGVSLLLDAPVAGAVDALLEQARSG